ncbi:MAG: arylsulfotransferase family protein [Pseudomonadota bacterium]
MSRVLGITCGTILLLSATFIAGIYATENRLFPYTLVTQVRNDFQQLLTEGDTLAGIRPKAWTAPPRQDGSGVTLHVPEEAGEELIMLQGLFDRGLEIRLVALDGTVVHRWPFSPATLTEGIEHLRNRPLVEWNYDTHGAVALPDGSVVFNIDHKALLKLDRCGELVWRVDEPTHHSVELNDDGSFWVSSADKHWDQSTLPSLPFDAPLSEDTLLQVGADGAILREISLLDVFLENDAMGLLTLAGGTSPKTYRAYRPDMSREVFHLNDVEALPAAMAAAFPGFEAGDVVISLRNRNLIMVLDPDTKAINGTASATGPVTTTRTGMPMARSVSSTTTATARRRAKSSAARASSRSGRRTTPRRSCSAPRTTRISTRPAEGSPRVSPGIVS